MSASPVSTLQRESAAVRARRLAAARRRATALLAGVTALFLAVTAAGVHGALLGYVQAGAEAAMVGGVADWFAVTALFRRPLGLPIPHTALIVERKDQFAASLGQFVQENFLNADVLAERIRSARLVTRLAAWLADEADAARLAGHAADLAVKVAEALRDEDVQRVLTAELTRALDAVEVAPLAGRALRVIIAGGHHAELFNAIVSGADRYLAGHYAELRDLFEAESPRWVPDAVYRRVFDRLYTRLRQRLVAMAADPDDEARRQFEEWIAGLPDRLETSPELRERGERFKRDVLGSAGLRDWSSSLWQQAKDTLRTQAADPGSELRRRLADALMAAGRRLGSDRRLQQSLERVVESAARALADQFHDELAGLVTGTIERWDATETSSQLELLLGRDLQFIRINGTVVGAGVGLALHAIALALALLRRLDLRGEPYSWDVCAMDERADIVVAGAGHNSLIAACYLAKAGYRCLVLDARHVPGGGATTEEILLPGYGIDTCATGHTLIRVNPLLTGDELGLIADYGLRYIDPDPVAHVVFPDGEQLTMWLDRDRTAAEIARFSAADAAAYLRLLDEYDEVKSVFSGSQFTPVGFGPSLDARLAEHPRGRVWQRRRALSAWEVIRHEFGSRHVQAFMLWMAFQTNQAVDVPGSGVLAYSLIFGRQQRSWSILAGGSGRLTEALTGYLHGHGGTVLCGKRVTRLLLDGDRCVGVETADGGQYRAGKAVLSTIHVIQLRDMAPARAWPEEFHYGIDTYDVGIPGFGVYLATSAPPEFAAPDGGSQTAVSAGTAGWPEDVIRLGQDLRAGRFVADVPWLLVATPTLADPTRAPSGKHTVKLLSQQVYELPAGMPGWDVVKARHAERQLEHLRLSAPGFTDDVILAQLVKSPADYEQLNPHMVHGAFHGGDRGVAQTGPLRPVPGWASHRMPIAGLYQTGATTHPGGSVTGAPGRNAAMVLLHDLGHDPAEVMSALPAAEVRGVGGAGYVF